MATAAANATLGSAHTLTSNMGVDNTTEGLVLTTNLISRAIIRTYGSRSYVGLAWFSIEYNLFVGRASRAGFLRI